MEIHHLSVLAQKQAIKYGSKTALRYKDYECNKWIPISWTEVSNQVDAAACAMLEDGIAVQENIGIFSQNKPECLFVELAAYGIRAVGIPLYATSSGSQVQYIINDACIRILFVGEQFQYDAAFSAMPLCPSLEKLIIFDRHVQRNPRDKTSVYFDEYIKPAAEKPCSKSESDAALPAEKQNPSPDCRAELAKRRSEASPEDVMNILYTSGTTGEPKGVLLHHSAFLAQMQPHLERFSMLTDQDVSMCFLPLTHVFEKAWNYLCMEIGMEVCINLKPTDIQTSLKEIRPTAMSSVPRFWEKVYQGVMEKINESSGMKRALMLNAIETGRKYNLDYIRLGKRPPVWLEMKYKFYERTVIALLKKTIGVERGTMFPTAGAAIPDKVNEFVRAVGIPIVVGYGLTESMATVSCDEKTHYTIGSIGRLMPGIEVKFGENNEILLRGKTITRGYYKKDFATKQAFTEDGFFRTGDAGYMKDGELYLTERIKDLFKTSNGKYIAPQQLESKLIVDRYIDQVCVVADQKKFVSALIVPVYPAVKDYAARHNVSYSSIEDLLKHPKILELFKARIDTLQQQFAHYEQVKRFLLLPHPFSMERGELTNTLKIRRSVVAEHYAAEIDRMYEEAERETHS